MKVIFSLRLKLFYALLPCLFSLTNIRAQVYNFIAYNQTNGIPSSTVTCIYQDSRNTIWLGTDGAGLVKYDGTTFKIIDYSNGLEGNFITDILEDDNHNLLLATKYSGVFVYNGQRIFRLSSNPDYPIQSKSFAKFAYSKQEKCIYAISNEDVIRISKEYTYEKVCKIKDFDAEVNSFIPYKNFFYIGSNKGLYKLKNNAVEKLLVPDVKNNYICIDKGKNGEIICATRNGKIFKLTHDAKNELLSTAFISQVPQNYNFNVKRLFVARSGNIWLGGDKLNGLVYYDYSDFTIFDKYNGFKGVDINCFLQDGSKNLFIGTNGSGLYQTGPQLFLDYTNIEELNLPNIFSIYVDSTDFYVGVRNTGIYKLEKNQHKTYDVKTKYATELGANVIIKNKAGEILAGHTNGIEVIKNGNSKRINLAQKGEKPISVTTIEQMDDIYLIGTYGNGLIITDNKFKRLAHYNSNQNAFSDYVFTITKAGNNRYYVGTNTGLFLLTKKEKSFTLSSRIIRDVISVATKDSYGNYWFSGSVLYCVDSLNKVKRYDRKNGLPSTLIYTLAGDKFGNIWIGNNLGLDKITTNKKGEILSIFHYNSTNGFNGLETNMRAQWITKAGTIYLGTSIGVIQCNAGFVDPNPAKPNVYISSIKFGDGSSVPLDTNNSWSNLPPNNYKFKYGQNNFIFSYGSQNKSVYSIHYYSTKLVGLENEWSQPTPNTERTFSNLDYGHYTFYVRIVDSYGKTLSAEKSYTFTINAPFYLSWWFILLTILFILLSLFALISRTTSFNRELVKDFEEKDENFFENRLYLLVMAIVLPGTEVFIEIFHVRNESELLSNIVFGLILFTTYILSGRNKSFAKKVPFIFRSLFLCIFAFLLYKTAFLPFEIITLSEILMVMFFAYTLLKNVKQYIIFFIATALCFTGMFVGKLITIDLFIIYLCAHLLIGLINYGKYASLLHTRERLIFADRIINDGKSLVIAANSQNDIVYISKNVQTLLGYVPEELMGKGWFEKTFDNQTDVDATIDILNRSLIEEKYTYNRKVKTKNGNYRWIQWQDKQFDGGIIVGIGQDITDQMEVQQKYQSLIQSATDIIYESDRSGKFTFVNEFAVKSLGYSEQELIGRHFAELIVPEYVAEVSAFYTKQLASNESSFETLEFPVFRKDHSVIWVSQKVTAKIDGGGKITGYNAIVRDITKARELAIENEKRQQRISKQTSILNELTLFNYTAISSFEACLDMILAKAVFGVDVERVSYWQVYTHEMVCEKVFSTIQKPESILLPTIQLQNVHEYFNHVNEGGIIVADDCRTHNDTKGFTDNYFIPNNIVSSMDIPIRKEGRLDSFLCFESVNRTKHWTFEDQHFGKSVAELISSLDESFKRREIEKAVIESENNFRQINETISDVFFLYQLEPVSCIYISPHVEKILGVTPEFFHTGRRYADEYVVEKDKNILKNAYAQIASGEIDEYDIEYRAFIHGSIRWIREKSFAIKNSKGETIKSSGFCSDITEQKNTEERIKQLSLVAEKTSNGIVIAEEDGKVIWANQSYLNMFEIPYEKLIGQYPKLLFSANDIDLLKSIDELNKKGKGYTLELKVQTYLKKPIWIELVTTPIVDNAGNTIQVEVINDITDRKKNEEKIKELSLVAEKTNNGVLISDKFGKVIWANQGYLNMMEIPMSELVGKRPRDIFNKNESPFHSEIEQINANDFIKEIKTKTFTGKPKWLELNNTIIYNENGEVAQQIEVVTDITERVERAEKISEYSEELEFQNQLKNKLINSSNFEEITEKVLGLILQKFTSANRVSLFNVDKLKNTLSGYSFFNNELKRTKFNIKEVKSYDIVKNGEIFIEKDLLSTTNKSASDESAIESGVISYIIIPLMFESDLIGTINVGFNTVFNLKEHELFGLQSFASTLAVSIKQIELKNSLFDKNKDIVDSLRYAQNIQRTILPDFRKYDRVLKEFVLLFRPKDIVSGDFYWAKETDEHLFVALADCTGHGVPGAFLTLIGARILEQIISVEKLYSPADILEKLDHDIFSSLNQNKEDLVRDGMEIALCRIDKKTKEIVFAGAGMGLLYFNETGEEVYLKGQRKAIGDFRREEFCFENTHITTTGKEKFFMATDGYQDQLGGDNYKRYSKRKLIELLNEIKHLNGKEQEEILNTEFKNFIGSYNQTDDVSILGFSL